MDLLKMLSLFGGLGLFIYGMKLMSDGLEAAAGERLRRGLQALAKNRWSAIALGAGITAAIHSSGATTIIVIGLVNAGLLTFAQAIFIGMGANIGTTMTAQMTAFNLQSAAPVILFAGIVMMLLIRNPGVKRAGQIVAGMGILFVGLNIMSEAVIPLQEWEPFRGLLLKFSDPLHGFLAGLLVTCAIQSSTATMGILQAFAIQGIMGLDQAVYVILGLNIGSCVTAILACLGGNKTAKRTAVSFLWFNIIGVAAFALILPVFPVAEWVKSWSPGDTARQIANFHTFFNIFNTVLLVGFPQILAKVSYWMIPGEDELKRRPVGSRYPDCR